MTEQYSLDLDEAQFAKMLFDHVREMSKDVAGVTRQGYGPLETQVLEYLKGIAPLFTKSNPGVSAPG